MRHLLATLLLLPATAIAQDMIATAWSGSVYAIDSFAGTATLIGTGAPGQNAMAVDGSGVIWSTTRTTSTPYVYDITVIDPQTAVATVVYPGADIRGMAWAGGSILFAELDTPDRLALIDTSTGTITPIGNMGFSGVQAIALHQGVLYGWDINQGLLTIDVNTGAATDINPAYTTGGAGIQFLASRSDGKLIGGNNNLYEIDVATAMTTQIGALGSLDLRGGGQYFGAAVPFGQGCAGTGGIVTLSVTGTLAPGGVITTTSDNHMPGAGALVLGFSKTMQGGLPLPLSLDPLLGTSGCSLLVSLGYIGVGVVPSSNFVMALAVPPTVRNFSFHVQHAVLEAVPGGMSLSNGVSVHVGF